MLPAHLNWNAVFQSITDTWLPLLAVLAAILIIGLILRMLTHRR